MDQAEQAKVTRAIGRALLKAAPEGWTSVRAEYRAAGRHIEVDVLVAGPDGGVAPVRPPQEVVEGLGALRAGMYQPGRGTWISATYSLEPPSSYSVDFDLDNEPRWRRLPPPIGFQDELRFFPRTDEFIPPWLRHRAGLPPAPSAPGGPPPHGAPGGPPPPGGPGGPGQPGYHPAPGVPGQQRAPGAPGQGPPPGVPSHPGQHGGPVPVPPGAGHPTPPSGQPLPPPGHRPPGPPPRWDPGPPPPANRPVLNGPGRAMAPPPARPGPPPREPNG